MSVTISNEEAILFAEHHVAVWNTHNLDDIMALYNDDVELHSPLAAKITNGSCVQGKAALREYFSAGINKYPTLHFKLLNTLLCVDTVTLYMTGANDSLLAEVLFIDDKKRIKKVMAHYAC